MEILKILFLFYSIWLTIMDGLMKFFRNLFTKPTKQMSLTDLLDYNLQAGYYRSGYYRLQWECNYENE